MAEREASEPAAPKVWPGRFYEDLDVGDVFRSRLGRTITEADNVWFTCLTMNTNQIHFKYSTEFEVERLYRDAPLMAIGEGTNDIMRVLIARALAREIG